MSKYVSALNGRVLENPKSFWEAEIKERRMNMEYEELPELIIQTESGEEAPNPEYEN